MKKVILLSIFPLIHTFMNAQSQALDTLYVNAHQMVSLSFESPIQKGITGSMKYAFSFNRDSGENLGLLQAQKDRESNLLVRTVDGNLYAFILAYKENLSQLHHFIANTQQLRNPFQKDVGIIEQKNATAVRLAKGKNNYVLLCKQLLQRERPFHHIKRQKGIHVKTTESLYHGNDVYIAYELRNRSAIPYELGHFQLSKVLGTKKRKASYQELPILSNFEFELPKTIGAGETIRFVVVYPKFTLNTEERLQLKVLETNGSRNFVVKLR